MHRGIERDIVPGHCVGMTPGRSHMAIHIRRREFIAALSGAVAAWPLSGRAQQPAQVVRRIGMLSGFAEDRLVESELLPTLSQLGWDNGRNVQIDLRWGAGNIDRIKMM